MSASSLEAAEGLDLQHQTLTDAWAKALVRYALTALQQGPEPGRAGPVAASGPDRPGPAASGPGGGAADHPVERLVMLPRKQVDQHCVEAEDVDDRLMMMHSDPCLNREANALAVALLPPLQ